MRPLGDIALGEYGPWELFLAAEETRNYVDDLEYEDEDEREETAWLFEQFGWTLVEIQFLPERSVFGT